MDNLPNYTGRHVDMELNGPHMAIYFDAELHDEDGNGWCVDASEGSVTYRHPTLHDALTWIGSDTFWEKFLKVRVV